MKKVAVAALAVLLFAGTAQAAEPETVSVVVTYDDLNLETPAGKAAHEARIDAAVDDVCAKPVTMHDLKAMSAWSECRKSAAASAFEQVGAADLATETFALLF